MENKNRKSVSGTRWVRLVLPALFSVAACGGGAGVPQTPLSAQQKQDLADIVAVTNRAAGMVSVSVSGDGTATLAILSDTAADFDRGAEWANFRSKLTQAVTSKACVVNGTPLDLSAESSAVQTGHLILVGDSCPASVEMSYSGNWNLMNSVEGTLSSDVTMSLKDADLMKKNDISKISIHMSLSSAKKDTFTATEFHVSELFMSKKYGAIRIQIDANAKISLEPQGESSGSGIMNPHISMLIQADNVKAQIEANGDREGNMTTTINGEPTRGNLTYWGIISGDLGLH